MLRLRQLTFGQYGHTLNRRQSISPSQDWIVYDTRNEDAHIARTGALEMVCTTSGDVVRLYETPLSSDHGPGVGAVAFHPTQDQIVFIHGLECCNAGFPYSAARRFGAVLQIHQEQAGSQAWHHAETRVVRHDHPSFNALGVLGGGTHAHSWNESSGISFTYNDAWLETRSQTDPTVHDARTVGFMIPKLPLMPDALPTRNFGKVDSQNFDGLFDAFLAATLHASPDPGSDQIRQAVEECWVGRNGYRRVDGTHQEMALAFQGRVVSEKGEEVDEVFVCDLPNLESRSQLPHSGAVASSETTENSSHNVRLAPHAGCHQRRLTYTADQVYPGIQGPRNWLVSSPDGSGLFFPRKDGNGIVQLCRVPTLGGSIDQVTDLTASIEGQITLHGDGTQCAFVCDQRIACIDLATGASRFVTERNEVELTGAVQFLSSGKLVCNGYLGTGANRFLQILIAE